MEEEQKPKNSIGANISKVWNKIPKELKPAIIAWIGYALLFLGAIIGVIILVLTATGHVDIIKEEFEKFGQKITNIAVFGFRTNAEAALDQEEKYYKQLDKIAADFEKNYNVQINTTLITATLFYNRVLGDYNTEQSNDSDEMSEADNLKETAEFYKRARSHIQTLAGYMLVKSDIVNKCGDKYEQKTTPKTKGELASLWYGGEWFFGFDTHNRQTITYTFQKKKTFPSCDYEDITTEAIQHRSTLLNTSGADSTEYKNFVSTWFDEKGNFSCPQTAAERGAGNCVLKKKKTTTYSVDWTRKSVYYYRLMENPTNAFGMVTRQNFIAEYYKDWMGEASKDEDVLRTVEGIYALYDSIKGSSIGYGADGDYEGGIIGGGPWIGWKQMDAAWGDIHLGPSSGTIYWYGCLITSIAIQMANSGTQITIPNFNPGTLVLNMPNGFDGNGNLKGGNPWSHIAPNFVLAGQPVIPGGSPSLLEEYLSQGYYPVVRVKYDTGQHWVAVIGVENGRVIMADPASNSNDMFSKYPETTYHSLTVKLFKG